MSVEGTLRSTLQERAAALPPGRPDVSTLLARGEASRTGRRHRRMVVLAAVAAVVLVLVGVSRLGDPERDATPTGPPDRGDRNGLLADAAVIDVGGPSGEYFAIDPAAGLLYVGIMQDEGKLALVDTTSGVLVDTVDLGAPYASGGLALDAPRDLLYVALDDREDPAVAVLSTVTRQVVDTIEVGPDTPDDVFMGDLVFDSETRSLFATTTVFPAQHSQRTGSLAIVDTASRTLVDRISVSEGSNARAVALDEDRHVVYASGRDDQLLVVDTRTRAIVDTIDGVGPSGCLSFDPVSDLLFNCSETYGTVTVVDADAHEVLTKLRVGGFGPFGVAIDSQAGHAYIHNKLVDLETLKVVGTFRPPLAGLEFPLAPLTVDQATRTVYGWGVLRRNPDFAELIAFAPPTT